MKSTKALVAATALALACTAGSTEASAANLITNGSFETGDLTGWTSNSGYGLNPFGTAYGSGMDGTYWHWLAGYEEPITTSQIVNGLTVGATYTLSWIMASEFTSADSLRLSINGGPGTLFTASPYTGNFWDNWETKVFSFTATSTSAAIQFDTVGLNAGGFDVGIDKVSLEAASAVPEPATWLMMMFGFGVIGAGLRRRQQSANIRFTF